MAALLIHRVRSSGTMHSVVHTVLFGLASIIFVIGMYVVYDYLHHYIGFAKKAVALGMVGILLMSLNMFVVSPFVMDVVDEKLSTATVMTNDTWEDDDWLNATSERSFFAWNFSNADEWSNDADVAKEFEKVGPFTYNLTTKREVLYHDENAGTLTYREYNVYDWCEDCLYTDESGNTHESLSGDSQLTNLNILFQTQKVGAAGAAIEGGESFVKGAFASDMMYVDLSERAPSRWVSDDISNAGEEAMIAEVGWASMGANNPEIANETLHHVLFDSKDPGDSSICIALTCEIGPMLMVRGGVPDNATNSINRATMFGYAAIGENGIDVNMTGQLDWLIYNAIHTRFSAYGGGAQLESLNHTDLNDRLNEITGVSFDHEPTLQNLLFGVNDDGTNVGLLKCDSQKILCGSTHLMLGASESLSGIQDEYTLYEQDRFGYTDFVGVGLNWAGAWMDAVEDSFGIQGEQYEMILSGGSGWIDAEEWFYEAFGSIDPINNEYITLGLNQQGAWGPFYGYVETPGDCSEMTTENDCSVDLDPEITASLFSGPHKITGSFAQDFLYGEVMGYSVPMDENYIPTAGGDVHVWNDSLVAQIYDLDNNSASALRWLFSYTVYDQFLEPLLDSFYGIVPLRTQSINNWLFGWEDPQSGWVSLEKNATYFGCGDTDVNGPCSTNSASIYSVYTGAVGDHNPGEIIAEDGDIHLPWRTPARNASAYGMLDPVVQTGAVGSYYPADQPATANLGGYAIATSEITGKGSVYGIETQTHTFTVDPLANPIQAKLLDQQNILDIFPGALPVYFGGEVVMQMEPNVNAAIAGEMNSYFYLDTRGIGAINPTMDDLQPVFQISQSSSMTEEQSEDFKSAVITNMKPYSYWTNFDGADASYIDEITLLIWVLGIVSLLGCSVSAKLGRNDEWEVHAEEE